MIRPFHCGTQFQDWTASNCERCKKYPTDSNAWPKDCGIASALLEACFSDGYISDEIAERMNFQSLAYVWQCGKVEWTEEWKKEVKRHRSAF